MATNETATRFKSVVQKMNALGAAAFASVKKQNVIFGASFLAFVCMSLHIYDAPSPADDFYYELWCACMMACLFALPATLLTHKLPASLAYPVQILAAIAGGVLGFFAHRGFGNSVYSQLYYFGIFCAGVLVTVFVFIPKKNQRTYFATIFKYALFCFLMASVLLCVLVLRVFCQHVCAVSFLPTRRGKLRQSVQSHHAVYSAAGVRGAARRAVRVSF